MSSSLVRAVTVSLVILLPSLRVFAQTQVTPKTAKSLGSVSGKVTIKEKGAPGVVVALHRPNFFNPFEPTPRATTDQDGNYKINNVEAGAYQVVFGAVGYVPANNISRSHNIVVGDGENIENINFALVRGGVITGRITDADGRPVIQQAVQLFRADVLDQPGQQNQTQQRQSINESITDDRGIYRMFGLNPGRYKVAAGRGDFAFGYSSNRGSVHYKEVFYPDTQDYAKATVLEVGEGSESNGIDISLGRPVESFSASGRVIEGEKGQPVANKQLAMQRLAGDVVEYLPQFLSTNGLGEFTAEGLTPGKYGVSLMSELNGAMRAENTSFDIIDSDVTGITVRIVKGASINGIVVLETDDKRAYATLTQLEIQAYVQPSHGLVTGSFSHATIGGDGSFRIGGLPAGTVSMGISPSNGMSQMKGLGLSRIERDGVTQARELEVKEGEQVTGVRVIVNYGTAKLTGVVTIENGPLPDGARIFVRLVKSGEASDLRQSGVDERGHFLVDGLPSGSYEITASIVGGSAKPPRSVKQTVVLDDGGTTDVNITLDLASGPKP